MENSNLNQLIDQCIINTNNVIKRWKNLNKIEKLLSQPTDWRNNTLEFKQYVISVLKHQFRKTLTINKYEFRELCRFLIIQLDKDLLLNRIILTPSFGSQLYDGTEKISNYLQSLTEVDYFLLKNKGSKIEENTSIYFNENFNLNFKSIESINFN